VSATESRSTGGRCGLSGSGAGYGCRTECPDKTYAIIEARGIHRRGPGTFQLKGHSP